MTVSTQQKKGLWLVISLILILVVFAVCVFALVIWQGSQKPESSTLQNPTPPEPVTVEIPIDQYSVIGMSAEVLTLEPGDVSIFIPAGALSQTGQFFLTAREANLLAEAGQPGWSRPYVINLEYKDSSGNVLPAVTLYQPIEICFFVEDGLWSDYLDRPEAFKVEVYEDTATPPSWMALSFYSYPNRHQICGLAPHLSLFALAVQDLDAIQATETPPGVYDPAP
ncbi:MAG: hypothetical protein FJZ96_06980 [Chloroflexi bacterium]|nr:hypothetical protein [Chloroflexota bacterium]